MRKSFASRALGILPFTLIFGSSCSLVYDLSPDQCGNNSDCARFGKGFICSEGICECPEGALCDPDPTGGTGGASGTGGDGATGGTGGTEPTGGTGGSAGSGVGGSSGKAGGGGKGGSAGNGGNGGNGGTTGGAGGAGGTTGGTSGTGGSAGMPPEDECTQNLDCFELHSDWMSNPYACVAGKCQPLITEDCPVVLPLSDNGEWALMKPNNGANDPIILGGFANVPGGVPGIGTNNYDLALSELSERIGGVYAGTQNRHQLVMVVCHGGHTNPADFDAPAAHLINDLGVKGIVASMAAENLQHVWETIGEAEDVFFMMPINSDQELINIPDEGRIWHMLSGANALSVSLQPLLDMTRLHVENLGEKVPADDLKVALLTDTGDRFLADVGTYFKDEVYFNGTRAKDNSAAAFLSLAVDAVEDNSTDIVSVVDFAPHVVVGATTEDMLIRTIPSIEAAWDAATSDQPRPFYLLSPYNYLRQAMQTLIVGDTSEGNGKVALHKRILGFGWPATLDSSLYDAYQIRYNEVYSPAPGNENYYDAAYYLMYAVAGSTWPLDGRSIAAGMKRVTTGDVQVEIGPNSQMGAAVTGMRLESDYDIELIGTMGPPNWDAFGGRSDPGSVWCVDINRIYLADVLRYNTGTNLLEGDVSDCFTFPAP